MKLLRGWLIISMLGFVLSAVFDLTAQVQATAPRQGDPNPDFHTNAAQTGLRVPADWTGTNGLTKEQQAYWQQRAERIAKAAQKQREDLETNRKKSAAFLSENAVKEGVKVMPSGLQYKVLSAGHGNKPALGATVRVNYKAHALHGREFRNSWQVGKPNILRLNPGVMIQGLLEALLLMREGDHWELYMPDTLGLGEQGMPMMGIPPGDALIYDIELVSVPAPTTPSGESNAVAGNGKVTN
jgi:FKBP-type peptidyl-prolyl cis-trans isomerase FkpA/FKBP-type peptidyl-prolyl cis-trans isomerase FklB